MSEQIVVIGGAGNVGRGVTTAFETNGWKVKVIDPLVNSSFERFTDVQIRKVFSGAANVVYSAEVGNRDIYEEDPRLSKQNNDRFGEFCNRLAQLSSGMVVWYIGGSWTKRKPDGDWLVSDSSNNKPLSECNFYEKAKISAERNAKRLSEVLPIRFLDWASIVPNMADNFSIPRMVVQAAEQGQVDYSSGDYGRPLLTSVQAGEALLTLIKNDTKEPFEKYLIAGAFVPFSEFANTVKDVVEKETDKEVVLREMPDTPDFLRTRTRSTYLEGLGFTADKRNIVESLERNARDYLRSLG